MNAVVVSTYLEKANFIKTIYNNRDVSISVGNLGIDASSTTITSAINQAIKTKYAGQIFISDEDLQNINYSGTSILATSVNITVTVSLGRTTPVTATTFKVEAST